jgi:isoleucyl-tRNA synthetase
MSNLTVDYILDKYWEIIKEEINVKDIAALQNAWNIKRVFKPIGSQISAKFGKDTWNVIKFGKMWNIREWENGSMIVFDDAGNEWILSPEDYEISYEWLEWKDVAADGDIIAKLDLHLTPELEMEWMAREVSRFLNQMRKDADYNIDARVQMYYQTNNDYMENVISNFTEFLSHEALLSSVTPWNVDWDIQAVFNLDDMTVTFTLKN